MDLPLSFLDIGSPWFNDHDVAPSRSYSSWTSDDLNHSPRLDNGVESCDPASSVFVAGTFIPRATVAQDFDIMQRFMSETSGFGIGGLPPRPDTASRRFGLVVSPAFGSPPDVGFANAGVVASPTTSGPDDCWDVDPRSFSYEQAPSDRASEVGLSTYGDGGSISSHGIRRLSRRTMPFGIQTSSEVSPNMISSQGFHDYNPEHARGAREADRGYVDPRRVHQNPAVIHNQVHPGNDGPYPDEFSYAYGHQQEAIDLEVPDHADAMTDPKPTTTARTHRPHVEVGGVLPYQQVDGNASPSLPRTLSTTSGREQTQSRRSSRVTKVKPRKQCAEHPSQTFKTVTDWR